MSLTTRSSCPVCKGNNLKKIFSLPYNSREMIDFLTLYYKATIDIKKLYGRHYNLLECKNCNLIQQSKKINERVVNKIYESYYYNCPAPTISNIGTSEINKFLKYFKGRKNKKGKVLEIACFDGYILRKLKQEKWDVYGCDPSPTTKRPQAAAGAHAALPGRARACQRPPAGLAPPLLGSAE